MKCMHTNLSIEREGITTRSLAGSNAALITRGGRPPPSLEVEKQQKNTVRMPQSAQGIREGATETLEHGFHHGEQVARLWKMASMMEQLDATDERLTLLGDRGEDARKITEEAWRVVHACTMRAPSGSSTAHGLPAEMARRAAKRISMQSPCKAHATSRRRARSPNRKMAAKPHRATRDGV